MPISEGGRFTPNDRIVSPGVFARENNLTGIAQGVADIGGVIVAPFPKGPGFSPTLIRSTAELEEKFGVADGVYYGPYSAKEYLKERGLITVCRVGGLTGYHQQYPFVIYAEKGTWNRNAGVGDIQSSTSYLYPASSASALILTQSAVISQFTITVGGGNVTKISGKAVTTASAHIKFGAARSNASYSSSSVGGGSGSLIYYGQEKDIGTSIVSLYFTGSLTITASGASTSSLLTAAMRSGSFTGSIGFDSTEYPTFTGQSSPFDSVKLAFGGFSTNVSSCANPIFQISGLASGSFGEYNGSFTPAGTPTFDACTNQWTASTADWKLLAVLADTQNNPVDSDYKAQGFYGTTMTYDSSVTKSMSEINDTFNVSLKSTNNVSPYGTYKFSIDPSSPSYISNIFGKNPKAGDPAKQVVGTKVDAAYLYKLFEDSIATVFGDKTSWRISASYLPSSTSGFTGEPMKFTDAYSTDLTNGDSSFSLTHAYTPWILSQKFSAWSGSSGSSGSLRYPLFKVHTLSDGTNMNTSYKVEISNVKLAGNVSGTDWGTFTLTVRKYSDTDKRPVILESFQNLTLDPDSSNFIARRIGDRYSYINFSGKMIEFGDYPNNSKYIRIEMSENPWPITAVPYGFEAMSTPIDGGMGYWTPPLKYSKASVYGLNPGKYPSGMVFDDAPAGADSELAGLYPTSSVGIGVSEDTKQYNAPLPTYSSTLSTGRNSVFALDESITDGGVGIGSYLEGNNVVPSTDGGADETAYVKMRKFIVGFQGGFDGISPATPINIGSNIIPGNTQGLDCTNSTSAGSIAYKQAIAAVGNPDLFDINLIWTPGISQQHHSYVVQLVVDMCESRGDVFYITDLYSIPDIEGQVGQIDEVVGYADVIDTTYASAYYPWVKILDTNTNKYVSVPPSVVIPAVYAQSDKLGAEWFAPAGFNRGGIPSAKQVCDRLTGPERDQLYEGRVNPIAVFPGQGPSVWGQKTLYAATNPLDPLTRVNVRRLLINLKKFVASVGKYVVFEQNTSATRNKFLSVVNPYLESVQQRYGLYSFFVKMDDKNNTPDLIDQGVLYGQFWIKPTRTAEFLVFDFNLEPNGASFPTA